MPLLWTVRSVEASLRGTPEPAGLVAGGVLEVLLDGALARGSGLYVGGRRRRRRSVHLREAGACLVSFLRPWLQSNRGLGVELLGLGAPGLGISRFLSTSLDRCAKSTLLMIKSAELMMEAGRRRMCR